MKSFITKGLGALLTSYLLMCLLTGCMQRKLLFHPTHDDSAKLAQGSQLTEWKSAETTIGYAREVENPLRVWLVLHGNAGQAAHRTYLLPLLPETDSVFILEYPGYGARTGNPTKPSLNDAAEKGYRELLSSHPEKPIFVLGESIGTGPACHLGRLKPEPAHLVLITPFADLADLAKEMFPFLPIRLLLRDRWNNSEALAHYQGPVDVFAAQFDTIIPPHHARKLAESRADVRYHELPAGHNNWANPGWFKVEKVLEP